MEYLDAHRFIAFVITTTALIAVPGPATLGLAATGAAYGVRKGFRLLFGLIAGMGVVIACVSAGIAATNMALPEVSIALGAVSLTYFGYLAYKIWTAPVQSDGPTEAIAPGFVCGLMINLVLPPYT